MDRFSKNHEQFVPLNVLDADIEDTGYFGSNSKWIIIAVSVLVYPLILFVVLQLGLPLQIAIALFILWTIIFTYILRYKVLEEGRLRKQLRNMEENQLGNMSYFYGIEKVGRGESNEGRIFYKQTGSSKVINGFIVSYEKGSIVNVPQGHAEDYRDDKASFMRRLHRSKYNFRWYEVARRGGVSDGIKYYNKILEHISNPLARKVVATNISYITDATLLAEQRYKDYIIVTNTSTTQIREFRSNLEGIIRVSLEAHNYIKNAHILTHDEVQEFFEDYYMQSSINLETTASLADYKPLSAYATIKNVYDLNGSIVPLEIYDAINSNDALGENKRGKRKDVDSLLAKQAKEERRIEMQRVKKRQAELDDLTRRRNRQEFDDDEWDVLRAKVEEKYNKETYDPFAEEKARKKAQEERELEKQAQRLQMEERRRKEQQRKREEEQRGRKVNSNKKWYEEDDSKVNVLSLDDTKAEIGSMSIEDLLGDFDKKDDDGGDKKEPLSIEDILK